MFKANQPCRIQLASGKNTVHGQPIPGVWVRERCSVVKLVISSQKSSVRADSSASRGNAREEQADAVILLNPNSQATINDVIEVAGHKLRIMAFHLRYDVTGRLDHKEIHATMWSPA